MFEEQAIYLPKKLKVDRGVVRASDNHLPGRRFRVVHLPLNKARHYRLQAISNRNVAAGALELIFVEENLKHALLEGNFVLAGSALPY